MGAGQEVEGSHSRQEFSNQIQDGESSHVEDAAIDVVTKVPYVNKFPPPLEEA